MSGLTFEEFQRVSKERNAAWQHDGNRRWMLPDYGNATAGEAGELSNYIKKLQRVRDNLRNVSDTTIADEGVLKVMIGHEVADVMCYMVLVCIEERFDMGAACGAVTIDEFAEKAARWYEAEKLLRHRPWLLPDYGNDLEVRVGRLCEVLADLQSDADQGVYTPPEVRELLKESVHRVALCLGAICAEMGLNMAHCVVDKYNKVSDRVGLSEFKLAA